MILGLEGVHTTGTIVFNDRRGDMPRVRLTDIPGLHVPPPLEPEDDQKALGRLGEVPRRADRAGKTFTYEGIIDAGNIVTLRTYLGTLGAYFASNVEQQWTSAPHEDDDTEGLETRKFWARPLEFVPEEPFQPVGLEHHGFASIFSLVLRMSDPRFYFPDAVLEESSTLITSDGTGTITVPPEEEDPASDQAIQVTCENEGNIDTECFIIVRGPVWNPVVSNETTGKFLRFEDLVLDEGERIEIDTRNRTVRRGNGNNQRWKLDALSTWWDYGEPALQPGNNVIRLRGYTVAAPAELEVEFTSADIA